MSDWKFSRILDISPSCCCCFSPLGRLSRTQPRARRGPGNCGHKAAMAPPSTAASPPGKWSRKGTGPCPPDRGTPEAHARLPLEHVPGTRPLERLNQVRRPQGEQGRGEHGSLWEASTEQATPALDTVSLVAGTSLMQKLEDPLRVTSWKVAVHLSSSISISDSLSHRRTGRTRRKSVRTMRLPCRPLDELRRGRFQPSWASWRRCARFSSAELPLRIPTCSAGMALSSRRWVILAPPSALPVW